MIEAQQLNGQGEVMIRQKELVYELARFDDETYINEGLRKEHIDKAIERYGLDKEGRATTAEEDERLFS